MRGCGKSVPCIMCCTGLRLIVAEELEALRGRIARASAARLKLDEPIASKLSCQKDVLAYLSSPFVLVTCKLMHSGQDGKEWLGLHRTPKLYIKRCHRNHMNSQAPASPALAAHCRVSEAVGEAQGCVTCKPWQLFDMGARRMNQPW